MNYNYFFYFSILYCYCFVWKTVYGLPAASNSKYVSYNQFTKAFTSQTSENGGPYPAPPKQHYQYLIRNLQLGQISTQTEFAMFLAHVIQETAGSLFKESQCICSNYATCTWASPATGPGCYCGRGALQLSFPCNYEGASQFLYGDNRLYVNPDRVGTSIPDIWGTALWYWRVSVHSAAKRGQFGATTVAINGRCECSSVPGDCYGSPKALQAGIKRCNLYLSILKNWGLPADSCGGC